MRKLFDAPTDGTTGSGAAVATPPTTPLQGTQASGAAASDGSSAVDEIDELIAKLESPDKWEKLLNKAPKEVKEGTIKNVRHSEIQRRAEETAATKVQEAIAKVQGELEELRTFRANTEKEKREAARALMSEDELAQDDLKQELEKLRGKATLYDTLTNELETLRAREAIVEYAKEKWTILEEDDLAEIRKESDGAKMMDKAMQLASERMEKKMAGLDELASKVESLERTLNGNATFAATTGSTGGGGEVGENIERLYFEKPTDPDIRKRYREWRKQNGYPV